MLGVHDYTVILTYISVGFATLGILSGTTEHDIIVSATCLLICGVLDAFDGKVARTKKNRTEYERKFGIQIDSLSDVIAFGILPARIGAALIINSEKFASLPAYIRLLFHIVIVFYVISGVARLAHFNVTEDERQQQEKGLRKYYTGVPITGAVFPFPFLVYLQYALGIDLTIVYLVLIALGAYLYVSELKIKKLNMKQIITLIICGILVAAFLIVLFYYRR